MKSNRVSPYPPSQCFVSALRAYVPTAEAPLPLFSLYKVTYEHAYENCQKQQHHICYYAIDGTMKQCQFFIKPFCWIDRTAEAFFFCLNMPTARWTANTKTFKTCQQLLVRAPNLSCKYSESTILWFQYLLQSSHSSLCFPQKWNVPPDVIVWNCIIWKVCMKVVELNLDYSKCQQKDVQWKCSFLHFTAKKHKIIFFFFYQSQRKK